MSCLHMSVSGISVRVAQEQEFGRAGTPSNEPAKIDDVLFRHAYAGLLLISDH